MKTLHLMSGLVLVFSLALHVASCGGDEGAGQSSTGTAGPLGNACPDLCEVSGKLDCEGDNNQACSTCERVVMSLPWCEAQANTYWRCVASDEANFRCGGGSAGILWKGDEVCIPEFHAYALCACVGEGAGATPDPKLVCAAYCGKQAGLPCASATCEEDCLARTASNAFTAPGILANNACIAESDESIFNCDANGELISIVGDTCASKLFYASTCKGILEAACEDLCVAECGDTMCTDPKLPMSDACRACILKMPPTVG
jgi:hypothetical protein